ncbi:MAG: thioesterase family protein [Oscillospiraceae bacterium]|nr:thioesterase family protein [Oscillospiraceae bacterium]
METGIKGRAEVLVSYENTAAKAGSGDQLVFATPWMIGLMEEAAQTSVLPYLEEGQATVGTHLDVSHDAATPIGMKVWAESELIAVEGRKLVFNVSAYDECGLIGKGTHERFIINKEKFMARVEAKKAK